MTTKRQVKNKLDAKKAAKLTPGRGVKKIDSSSVTPKADGWQNVLTSMGVPGAARNPSTVFTSTGLIDKGTLGSIYRANGFGKRIIDLPATEMTREWFTVNNDTDGKILNYLKQLDAKNKITDLIRWSRLFGGAIIVMGIDDGRDLAEPVNTSAIRSVNFLHIFDRYLTYIDPLSYNNDPTSPDFGTISNYKVIPIYGSGKGYVEVHASRILRLDGDTLPIRDRYINQGWGASVIDGVYTHLMQLGSSYEYSSEILHDFIQSVLTIKNLTDMIGSKDGEEDIKKRLNILSQSRSQLNMMLLDADGETYHKISSNVSGLSDLIKDFALALSAVTGIPQTLLMGTSPKGMNATGESDIRNWYDAISAEQEDILKPELLKLINYILLAQDSPVKSANADNTDITFNPLWQMSDTDIATLQFTQAQADQIYVNSGILHPEEVAESRFGGGVYSLQTKLLAPRDIKNLGEEPPEPPTEEPEESPEEPADENPGEANEDK